LAVAVVVDTVANLRLCARSTLANKGSGRTCPGSLCASSDVLSAGVANLLAAVFRIYRSIDAVRRIPNFVDLLVTVVVQSVADLWRWSNAAIAIECSGVAAGAQAGFANTLAAIPWKY
jgi:hypothetical protein